MIKQKDLVTSSVAEFLGCWAIGGEANLTLNTVNGVTTVSFTTTLPGHPEAPLHPPPLPAGPPQQPRPRPRRHRGQAQKERDRQRAARHQAALAAAPPPSLTPTLAAAPVAPFSPEALRNTEKPDLDILNMSNTSETRMEEEAPSTPDHIDHEELPATRHIFKWNEDDIDGSITEATRIHNEMGGTGRCHFCDFTCDPNPCKLQPWYSHVMNDHLEANHPEAWEWFA